MADQPQKAHTLSISVCNKNSKVWFRSFFFNLSTWHSPSVSPEEMNPSFLAPLFSTWPKTFLHYLVDIKATLGWDIFIEETCWHRYQASKRLVSFWKGLMRAIEMLKAVLVPNITKGWEDMNTHWLKELKGERAWKKKPKFSREKEKRSAPFPPKKHRVKRWPLYKWNSISRHIIPLCSLSWLSFSLRPETIIN